MRQVRKIAAGTGNSNLVPTVANGEVFVGSSAKLKSRPAATRSKEVAFKDGSRSSSVWYRQPDLVDLLIGDRDAPVRPPWPGVLPPPICIRSAVHAQNVPPGEAPFSARPARSRALGYEM